MYIKNILILSFLLMSYSSFAFWGLFKKYSRPDPFTLSNEKEQMEYLSEYEPESYTRIIQYKQYLNNLRDLDMDIEQNEEEWAEYNKYSAEMYDEEKEKLKEINRKKEERKILEKKVKEMEEEILKQYKVVNGKLINRKEEASAEQKEQEEKMLREKLIEFQQERGLPVLKEGENIRIKRE